MHLKLLFSALLLMLISLGASTRCQAQELGPYTVFDSKTGTLTFYYGKSTTTSNCTNAEVKKIVIDESYSNYNLGSSLFCMFRNYENVTSIEGLGYINTNDVTDMESMFSLCKSLKSIDVTGFNTSKVTKMAGMFAGCSSLTELDLSSFNTANVKDLYRMFGECTNLTTIYVSKAWKLDLNNLTAPYGGMEVFDGCEKLKGKTKCDGINNVGAEYATTDYYLTSKKGQAVVHVEKPDNWVYNDRLHTLNIGTNLGVLLCKIGKDGEYSTTRPSFTDAGTYTVYYKVEDGDDFKGVSEQSITINIAKTPGRFYQEPQAYYGLSYSGKEMELVSEGIPTYKKETVVVYSLDGKTYSTDIPKATNAGDYTVYYKIREEKNYAATTPKTIKVTIAKVKNPISIMPNSTVYNGEAHPLLSKPSTFEGTITYTMDGKDYTEIPTAINAGTYKITCQVEATDNYYEASKVVTVIIQKAFNRITQSPSAIYNLVANDNPQELISEGRATSGSLLYSLDGKTYSSSIPTAVDAGEYTVYYKVDESENYDAIAPASIKVTIAEKKAPEPTKVAYALLSNNTLTFYYGEEKPEGALSIRTSSDDSNWPVSLCRTITNVVFDKSFKEYKPFKTSSWFRDCENLTELSGMDNINTEDLEYMDEMFQFCNNLKSVDFSTFNTSKVTNMTRVFWGCENLESVFVGEDWTTSALKKSSDMFGDCFKLYGGKGTAYNADQTDATYAHIDGGANNPGYFTKSGEPAFKKVLASIEISTLPTTEYTEGDAFSAENGKLTLTYNTGDKETVNLSEATITGYDKTKVGEQTLKVEYQGVETSLLVAVKAKEQQNNNDNNNNNNGNNDNPPTPVSSVDNTPSVKVWSYAHTIYIASAPDSQYKIVDLQGRTIATSTTTSSLEQININKSGILVVIINGKSYKVSL